MNEPQIISHVTKGDKRDLIFQAKDLVGYSSWGRKRVGHDLATTQMQQPFCSQWTRSNSDFQVL